MPKVIVIQTTVGSADQAQALSTELLDARLAACVQIDGPILSSYRWRGERCSEPEHRLSIKTTADCLSNIEQLFEQCHPYDIPQFIVLETNYCSSAYQAWVLGEVAQE